MRYLVIFILICILASLFSALFFMFRDKGDSKRMVRALTLRVALSVTLFLLLMAGFYFGLIGKGGL
jgi:Na+-driven multidrug efflux pump